MNVLGVRVGEKQVIGGVENPLLIRWVLIRFKPWGIYLHKLCRSDYDRALHDHPWPFVSIVIKGGYWEVHDQTMNRRETRFWRGRGEVMLRPAEWRHRVVLGGRPAWTVVVVGRRFRRWGFYLPEGWCWWRKHDPEKGICADEVLWTGGSD